MHDNASIHTSYTVVDFLEHNNITTINYKGYVKKVFPLLP
jgi:hypothetical protein